MPTRRVRLSRWLSVKLIGAEVMVCALADWHRWRIRPALNLAFRWRERDHCGLCADWEARTQTQEAPIAATSGAFVDDARRLGLL